MKRNPFFSMISLIMLIILLNGCQTENKIARQKFKSEKTKILVCPVHILDNGNSFADSISATKIADYINAKKYAVAQVTDLIPPTNGEWRHNEAKMLTISINKFIEFVKKSKLPDDTYILHPEFLKLGKHSSVVAIHYCLLNNKGEIVFRGLINSHWPQFQKVNPRNNADCIAVFINGFEDKMANTK